MSATESLVARASALRALIEAEADAIEQAGTMSAAVVDALVDAGLFRLLVPETLGGSEASVAEVFDVCEELAYADGSVGWAFAQNTTVMAYAAYLAPEFAEPLARARAAAGMFAPLGSCAIDGDGFRVQGQFAFGSGSGHAEFMGGAGMVTIDGEMAPFENDRPQIRAFIVPTDRVIMKGNWNVMGLRGTGSFDFEVPEQLVDHGQTFPYFHCDTVTGGPIYGLGPIVLGTISSTAWAIGVAKRALHEIAEIARGGRMRLGSQPLAEQAGFQRDFGFHHQAVRAARMGAVSAYEAAVEGVAAGAASKEVDAALRETKAAASYVTRVSKLATTMAYEAAGSHGMRNPSRLQRCFRDILVGAQHQVFDARNFAEYAKPSFGIEPAFF